LETPSVGAHLLTIKHVVTDNNNKSSYDSKNNLLLFESTSVT